MCYENIQDILSECNIPQSASADAEAIIQGVIDYAKARNAGAAECVYSHTLATSMSKHTLPVTGEYVSISEANKLLSNLIKYQFLKLYTVPHQALDAASTEACLKTMLRLEAGEIQNKQDMDEIGLKVFPAHELCLWYHVGNDDEKIAACKRRWVENGGIIYNGKMIALANDPVWLKMSIFGRTYPPFDFECCFGKLGVPRRECINLGLIKETRHPIKARNLKLHKIRLSIKLK